MNVLYCKRVATAWLIALLAGCQREAPPPASQQAASEVAKPVGAVDDTPRALTDEVIARTSVAIPVGDSGRLMVIPTGQDAPDQYVRVSPGPVLAPDVEHRLLVAQGVGITEGGEPYDGHASGGNLGLFEFTLKQGRWLLTSQVPSFARRGSWGKVGDLQALDLGGGRVGVAVNSESCGQGYCENLLEIFALNAKGAVPVLSEPVVNDSEGWSGPCDDMVKEAMQARSKGETELDWRLRHCIVVRGDMTMQRRSPKDWPDIKIDFSGEAVDIDEKTFEVARANKATALVLRYDGQRYKPINGRNPLSKQ
ncbi:hypothetical protein ACS5PN_12915 [Roseateles sp. NT4]|uniref:hypothetical protein n=1 Tax=Roseateles sp. NT4 TaxID=3453715 RepID=UPI003EE96034